MEKNEEIFQTKEERIGAFIRHECSDELDFKLERLSRYQAENNIGNIKYFYTADSGDLVAYYKVITDIFEENIDTLLVVGILEDLYASDDAIDKIINKVKVFKV